MTRLYRKVHLFYEEKLYFAPGNLGFPVFAVEEVKVGMLICFDHLFPEAARSLALQGVQLICHPSNLVMPTKAQLSTRVRAMENRVFWAMCNRFGTEDRGDKTLTYTGESQMADRDGALLAQAPREGELLGSPRSTQRWRWTIASRASTTCSPIAGPRPTSSPRTCGRRRWTPTA